jgi:hypothetical protein
MPLQGDAGDLVHERRCLKPDRELMAPEGGTSPGGPFYSCGDLRRLMKFAHPLRHIAATFVLMVAATACRDASAAAPEMIVYATPSCGCCNGWVEHMRDNGFQVSVVHQDDLSAVREQHHVPAALRSCHVGIVDGFAVEGHVPADAVRRLLAQRPAVLGIAVPGMPAGSPGMEQPNGYTEPYEIYTFDASGPKAIFEIRN